MKRSIVLSFFLTIILTFFQAPSHASNYGIDDWLDPKLSLLKKDVEKIISDQINTKIPCSKEEDWGFSFTINANHLIFLQLISNQFKRTKERVSVADLGCGNGYFSALAILAGGKVHAVEKNSYKEANMYIFKTTKNILGYDKDTAKNFYSVFPQDILGEKISWNETKHKFVLCDNVLHFFSPDQCDLFAKRSYENMLDNEYNHNDNGVIFITADSPHYHKTWFDFYKRNSKSPYPGYGVYSKKRTNTQHKLDVVGNPVEVKGDLIPGKLYPGHYTKEGKTIDIEETYHTVKNLFTKEDLATVFTKQGFSLQKSYYLDMAGKMIENESDIQIGKPYKACVMLIKPYGLKNDF